MTEYEKIIKRRAAFISCRVNTKNKVRGKAAEKKKVACTELNVQLKHASYLDEEKAKTNLITPPHYVSRIA
jgi:hypothetical protein